MNLHRLSQLTEKLGKTTLDAVPGPYDLCGLLFEVTRECLTALGDANEQIEQMRRRIQRLEGRAESATEGTL